MRTLQRIVLLVLVTLSTACASKFFVPGNRMMIPEGSGKSFEGQIHMGLQGVTSVTVADFNMNLGTPDLEPVLSKNSDVILGAELGLLKRLDGYYYATLGGPGVYGLKFQILGDSRSEAKEGNFSLAVAGGVVYGHQETSLTTTMGSGVETLSEIKLTGWEALALMGYRHSDQILFYGGPFVMNVDGKATVKQSNLSNGAVLFTSTPDGDGEFKGVTVGMRIGAELFLNLEAAYTEASWTRTNPTEQKADPYSETALGASVGVRW